MHFRGCISIGELDQRDYHLLYRLWRTGGLILIITEPSTYHRNFILSFLERQMKTHLSQAWIFGFFWGV